jgi:hypothetical protein
MRWIAVVVMMAGCSARPLAVDECGIPGDEETQAAAELAWSALDGPGDVPRVSWSCDCIEREGNWCVMFDRRDPMLVTWMARPDGDRVIHPERISESLLGYVLAVYADSLGAKMEPTVWDAGERARQVLAAEGF